jgi:hypothetical protein
MENKEQKQSAIEYFYEKVIDLIGTAPELDEAFEKAKKMHKEEIINTYQDGRSDQQSSKDSVFYNRNAEKYYNEQFKK